MKHDFLPGDLRWDDEEPEVAPHDEVLAIGKEREHLAEESALVLGVVDKGDLGEAPAAPISDANPLTVMAANRRTPSS